MNKESFLGIKNGSLWSRHNQNFNSIDPEGLYCRFDHAPGVMFTS